MWVPDVVFVYDQYVKPLTAYISQTHHSVSYQVEEIKSAVAWYREGPGSCLYEAIYDAPCVAYRASVEARKQEVLWLLAYAVFTALVIVTLFHAFCWLWEGVLVHNVRSCWEECRSRVRRRVLLLPPTNPSNLKGMVFQVALPSTKVVANHSHPNSAAVRSQAASWLARQCAQIGRVPLFFQGSHHDAKKGRELSMAWHWTCDLNVPERALTVRPEHVLVLVDVDYYVDMPTLLARYPFNPICLYTFTPSEAGAMREEYTYRFDRDGSVIYAVSGGAEFSHRLWDYSSDDLRAAGGWFDETSYWMLERRQLDKDHSVVWLFPAGKVRWGCDWLARFLDLTVDARCLQRFNPVQGDFVRFRVNQPSLHAVTTARVGSSAACTIPASTDSVIRAAANAMTATMTAFTIASHGVDKDSAPFLVDYYRNSSELAEPSVALGIEPVVNYEMGPHFDGEAKPSVVPFMQPLVSGSAFAPLVSEGNEATAVKRRVLDIANDAEVDHRVDKYIDEFVDMFLQKLGLQRNSLYRHDFQKMWDTQCSAAQRRQIEQVIAAADMEQSATAFLKREPYPELKEPRIITNFHGTDKTSYSLFIYALSAVTKQAHWYGFVEPAELERKICERVCRYRRIVEGDVSRQDGRTGKAMRLLELRLALALFHFSEHDAFLSCWRNQNHKRVWTAFSLSYHILWARGSGSAETSCFNTDENAFIQYMAFRVHHAPGDPLRGATQPQYSPSEAWDMIGLAGGDDMLTSVPDDFDVERFTYAASLVGHVYETAVVPYGSPACFLGRLYGELSVGSPNGCSDIRRQLVKFHLTTDKNVPALVKFVEKASAYTITDPHTPILSLLGAKAQRIGNTNVVHLQRDGTLSQGLWLALQGESRFTNRRAAWMDEWVAKTLPGFDMARFCEWCQSDSLCIDRPFLVYELNVVTHMGCAHVAKLSHEDVASLRKRKKRVEKPDARAVLNGVD